LDAADPAPAGVLDQITKLVAAEIGAEGTRRILAQRRAAREVARRRALEANLRAAYNAAEEAAARAAVQGVDPSLDAFNSSAVQACVRALKDGARAARARLAANDEDREVFVDVVAVSVLLCTVTFYANLAHNLTRSP
jgi:hypothetical protein